MTSKTDGSDAYLRGTELLCAGHAVDALEPLESVPPGERSAHHMLALGKAYLEVGRGTDALECLLPLAESRVEDSGLRGYLAILIAAALAQDGRGDDATAQLEHVAEIDSRLERAARALRQRIAEGDAPLVHL